MKRTLKDIDKQSIEAWRWKYSCSYYYYDGAEATTTEKTATTMATTAPTNTNTTGGTVTTVHYNANDIWTTDLTQCCYYAAAIGGLLVYDLCSAIVVQ